MSNGPALSESARAVPAPPQRNLAARLSDQFSRLVLGNQSSDDRRFPLLRYFSVVSGIVIFVLTVAAVLLYRTTRYDNFISQMQSQNEIMTRVVKNTILRDFKDFLEEARGLTSEGLKPRRELREIDLQLRLAVRDTGVLKFKVYTPEGLTIYSSDLSEVGSSKAQDAKFKKILSSKATSSSISYRDRFNALSGTIDDIWVMDTYVPVIGMDNELNTITELYIDISDHLAAIRSETMQVGIGIVLGFAALYLLLYMVVVRANQTIARQTSELKEFSADLEARVERRTMALKSANQYIESLNSELEARVEARTTELQTAHEEVHQLNVDLAKSILELREAQDQIIKKGKLAQLGQLTATVAHEIRNPLGAIKTSAQLVERKIKDKNLGLEKALDRINNGIRRCDHIITELLDFARTKALARKSQSFDAWVDSIVTEELRNIPSAVTIERTLTLGDKQIEFDADRMRRVLVKLLSNASEALMGKTPGQTVELPSAPKIEVITRIKGPHIELLVKDNGPGISEENMKRILEPLFTTKSFGVGLGLPAVEKVLEQHGGGLRIESALGQGATFTAWFPLEQPERQAA